MRQTLFGRVVRKRQRALDRLGSHQKEQRRHHALRVVSEFLESERQEGAATELPAQQALQDFVRLPENAAAACDFLRTYGVDARPGAGEPTRRAAPVRHGPRVDGR